MTSASIYGQPPELPADCESTGLARRRSSPCGSVTGRSPRRRSTCYSPARGPSAGTVRRHDLAVLTVDRVDDAGHRFACQQGAGHRQRVIDDLFGFEQRLGAFELPHG
jgi:hypothetical protein